MKKSFLIFIMFFLSSISVIADIDDRFFNALSTCTPYTNNGAFDTAGIAADYNSQILGWSEDKCVFKEKVNLMGLEACVICKLSKPQIKDFTDLATLYKDSLPSNIENMDVSSIEELKNNPVINLWNQYVQDPEVCTLNILETKK